MREKEKYHLFSSSIKMKFSAGVIWYIRTQYYACFAFGSSFDQTFKCSLFTLLSVSFFIIFWLSFEKEIILCAHHQRFSLLLYSFFWKYFVMFFYYISFFFYSGYDDDDENIMFSSFKECLTHISFQLDTIPSSFLYIKRLYVSSFLIMLCFFLRLKKIVFIFFSSTSYICDVSSTNEGVFLFIHKSHNKHNRIQFWNSEFYSSIHIKYNVTFLMSRNRQKSNNNINIDIDIIWWSKDEVEIEEEEVK